jgi:hypothetical protein
MVDGRVRERWSMEKESGLTRRGDRDRRLTGERQRDALT